jgi:hypothetical protein
MEVVPGGVAAGHIIPHSASRRTVARIQTIRPGAGEVFYMRSLLQARPATSFEDLRIIDGVLHGSFSEAARALGLFESQEEGMYALSEAITDYRSAAQLRFLFANLIMEGSPAPALWEMFSEQLCADFVQFGGLEIAAASENALAAIATILHNQSHTLRDYGLPDASTLPNIVAEEFAYFADRRQQYLQTSSNKRALMNEEQSTAFDLILSSLNNPTPNTHRLFFIDGRAGRGKSFVCKAICQAVRGSNCLVCIAGSTALSIREYPRGRTMHNLFKITVDSVSILSYLFSRSKLTIGSYAACSLMSDNAFSRDTASAVCRPYHP